MKKAKLIFELALGYGGVLALAFSINNVYYANWPHELAYLMVSATLIQAFRSVD